MNYPSGIQHLGQFVLVKRVFTSISGYGCYLIKWMAMNIDRLWGIVND